MYWSKTIVWTIIRNQTLHFCQTKHLEDVSDPSSFKIDLWPSIPLFVWHNKTLMSSYQANLNRKISVVRVMILIMRILGNPTWCKSIIISNSCWLQAKPLSSIVHAKMWVAFDSVAALNLPCFEQAQDELCNPILHLLLCCVLKKQKSTSVPSQLKVKS